MKDEEERKEIIEVMGKRVSEIEENVEERMGWEEEWKDLSEGGLREGE